MKVGISRAEGTFKVIIESRKLPNVGREKWYSLQGLPPFSGMGVTGEEYMTGGKHGTEKGSLGNTISNACPFIVKEQFLALANPAFPTLLYTW